MKLIFETEEDLLKYETRLLSWLESAVQKECSSGYEFQSLFDESLHLLGNPEWKSVASEKLLDYYNTNLFVEKLANKEKIKTALSKLTTEERKLLGLKEI